ncbi:MAG: hypothetical protein IBX55_01900 [Methyloprofundus sp.]|nr:hypothetical protein [Methyloprofundus sp.]
MNKKTLKNSLKTSFKRLRFTWGATSPGRDYYRASSGRQREWYSDFSIKSWFLRNNLSIAGLVGVMLMPVAANADVVRVNGTGSASCPAGYSLVGLVQRGGYTFSDSSAWGDVQHKTSFTTLLNCSSISENSVSGCTGAKVEANYVDYLDNPPKEITRVTRINSMGVTIICARTCSN